MSGYQCSGCDGAEPAAILITPLNGADTLPIGQECMAVTLTGILAGTVGVDPEQLWAAIEQLNRDALAAAAAESSGAEAVTAGEGGQAASGPPGAAQGASGRAAQGGGPRPAARARKTPAGRPRRSRETVRGLPPLSPELQGKTAGDAS